MTRKQLEAVIAAAGASFDKQGTATLPDETTITLHLAHDGASLSVPRVVVIALKDDRISAEDEKGARHFCALDDVYAASVTSVDGKSGRKAGFLS